MTFHQPNGNEAEQRRLRERLQELEAEIQRGQLPQSLPGVTSGASAPSPALLWAIVKFGVLFILTVAVVRAMVWLGSVLILLVIAWVLYQILFTRDRL